jgi:hypothetical protein
MAWEEQRRLRDARGETAKIEGLPVASASASASARGRAARAERWGQRFGWMGAIAVALVALIFALLAFANAGATTTAFVGRRAGAFAPYGRPGGGLGGAYPPGFGPGAAPPR